MSFAQITSLKRTFTSIRLRLNPMYRFQYTQQFPQYKELIVKQPLTDVLSGHYSDIIMGAMASQIFSHTIVYSTVYSGADQRKHQSAASLAFVWGIHR